MRYFSNDLTVEYTSEEVENLKKTGKFTPYEKVIAHHEAIPEIKEVGHKEIIRYANGGKEVRCVVDVPYQPAQAAYDEIENVMRYVAYEDEDYIAMRSEKVLEMSNICSSSIEAGTEVLLSDGTTHHFDMTTNDQLNLAVLYNVALQGVELIPYHAKDEPCVYYSSEDMINIYTACMKHAMYHQTYFNSLKQYINSLTTKNEIDAVNYGMEIPEEYSSEVLKELCETNN